MVRNSLWAAVVVALTTLGGCQQEGGDPDDAGVTDAAARACGDGLDNDGDGLVDLDDPGCDGPRDDDESNAASACSNGVDDDDDGAIDLDDPGCEDAADDDETDPVVPQCDNGIDDDDDGAIDLDDAGCANRRDDDESDEPGPPACSNGVDDDDDGFIDFPTDPGCGSAVDNDERNGDDGPALPQCGNAIDDDGDGWVDLADPGCSSVADPREADPEERPPCANGDDDDADGIADFPLDPGCSAAGDDDEADPAVPPACGDGLDNDADGLVDYPDDPGCQGVGDRDEGDPRLPPACADGVDNDRDDAIDYPADPGCESAADTTEGGACGRTYTPIEVQAGRVIRGDSRQGEFEAEGSCGGRGAPEEVFVYRVSNRIEALVIRTDLPDNQLESAIYVRRGCLDARSEVACVREPHNDGVAGNSLTLEDPRPGEYYIFLDGAAGRGGPFALVVEEVPLAACLNGLDDDGDGLPDYPNDPGCMRPDDRDEADPAEPPVCFDDRDNDGDGQVDFPLDFGCLSAADGDEVDVCGQGLRIDEYPTDALFVLTDTSAGEQTYTGSCGGQGPERVFAYENPFNAALEITVDFPETQNRTNVYVRTECTAAGSELGCDTGEGEGVEQRGTVGIDRAPPGTYYIFVDTTLGIGGPVKLAVSVRRLPPGCSDEVDNDGDGFIDDDDVGCSGADDEDERDPVGAQPACSDGRDNDEDGLVDYPLDPGCRGKGDEDEADDAVQPQCANGEDDDGDGLTDWPDDVGCAARGDDSEENDRRAPQCNNRIDDDMDGVVDYPDEPGCASRGDRSEVDDDPLPACADGVDNDRDGLTDYPFDPGCPAAGATSELDFEEAAACNNRVDDDDDGLVDFPFDPGCTAAGDTDETDPGFPPACANGVDDDGDGLRDFPNDRGCRFAGDRSEEDGFDPPTRCENSVDDDGDGLVDLRDPGCANGDDDDEADPAVVPECANEIDDDEDGLIDWPDDFGCQARGDTPESQMCRDGVEVGELALGVSTMGETVEGDPDRYRGRCGGREAPDAVYRYVLEEPATLTFSADHPGTEFPAVLTVTRDCEEARAMVGCAGDFRRPEPTVVVPDAEPGEYYVIVDGGGPERIVTDGGAIAMPVDPDGFNAQNDIGQRGWVDGGNDAFDTYGATTITHNGAVVSPDMSVGQRQLNVGGYGVVMLSEQVGNVWRLRYTPAVDNDERPVTFSITGNLGSDGGTIAQTLQTQVAGRPISYLYTHDNGAFDPPVVHFFVPSDPEHFDRVSYANNGDNVTIQARDITLPATFYVALSYAARGNNSAVVANALVDDLEIQAGAGGGDAPRAGRFELTVEAE